jgi:hypothetical protein
LTFGRRATKIISQGLPADRTHDSLRLIRMSEVPEIEVHMIKSADKIGGVFSCLY